MSDKLVITKATITAGFTAVATFLGWRTILLLVWVCLMGLDYLSGSLAARSRGAWKSEAARAGIFHKAGMILVVVVSIIADFVMVLACRYMAFETVSIAWPVVLFPLVTMWYILTEAGSIIENAIAMGAKVPQWLPRLLNATLKAVESAAGQDE